MSESIITDVYTGEFVHACLVDETPEITVENNVYTTSEALDLITELREASLLLLRKKAEV